MRPAIRRVTMLTALPLVLALFGGSLTVADDAVVRYDDHRVVRVIIETEDDLTKMMQISPDCWCESPGIGVRDFRVPPENLLALELSGLSYEVLINNVQVAVDQERARLAVAGQADGGAWFDDFKNRDAINARLDEYVAAYPELAGVDSIGDSIEGREIRVLTISTGGAGKPAILYNACQHAREWIAPMTAMYVADELLSGYGQEPRITDLLDTVDVYIIPLVNPDGYVYSWGPERYWRKNRRDNGGGAFGVDPNRNWALGWGGGGSSGDPNDQVYRGIAPFSEPETQAMRDFYQAHPEIGASIDFHSYGEYVLYPWAYQEGGPDDDGEHAVLANAMEAAIQSVHNNTYVGGPVFETLYQASGGSVDWTWGDQGVISYTIELRGNDFVINPDQILPTGEENFEAAVVLAEAVQAGVLFTFPNGLPTLLTTDTPTELTLDANPITSGPLDTASGRMYQRVVGEATFAESRLTWQAGNVYTAWLDGVPCGTDVEFYFAVESTSGVIYRSPASAAADLHQATAVDADILFADDFEVDEGWWVASEDLADGAWERGVPAGAGDREDPTSDYDGSGSCYLTDNTPGNSDVDGGPTRLTSPVFDLTGLTDPVVSYARWFSNDDGDGDRLDVEISPDGGNTWALIESTGNTGGWIPHQARVLDYVALTDTIVLRFSVADNPNNSVTEAAVDAVTVIEAGCDDQVVGDVDGDGDADFGDLLLMLAAWGSCDGCPEDLDGNGSVGFEDLLVLLANWS